MSQQQEDVREFDGLTVTWGGEETPEQEKGNSDALRFTLIFLVLAALIVPATVFITRHFSIIHQLDNPVNAGRQSIGALEAVQSHVGQYLKTHGQMPQYVGLRQLGVQPEELADFPLVKTVRVLGGTKSDKQWTSLKARIRDDIKSPIAGYSVVMELEALLTERGKPTGKFMSSCYVRGPNNQRVRVNMALFPRQCQRDRAV